MTPREVAIAAPLLAFAILFGVYPQAILGYVTPTVNQQAQTLADWTKTVPGKKTDAVAVTSTMTIQQ
jgi:NADH:ubiquinone oxidoreductase subunit 4 (subunit M)